MATLRFATWNINSVRLRLPSLKRLIDETGPDVICLQETKVVDELFPADNIAGFGYPHQAVHGMKGYNGVAILSRLPFKAAGGETWCGRDDARHAWVELRGGVELHNFYVPAGGDVPDPETNPKFAHKLHFMTEMANWWTARKNPIRKAILVGDLNVAPLETDVWSHRQLLKVVSHTPVETARFEAVRAAGGWADVMRAIVPPEDKLFTWWSYRSPNWRTSDRGRRLDHVWASPDLAKKVASMEVLHEARGWEKPSDHVPVTVTFK